MPSRPPYPRGHLLYHSSGKYTGEGNTDIFEKHNSDRPQQAGSESIDGTIEMDHPTLVKEMGSQGSNMKKQTNSNHSLKLYKPLSITDIIS